MTDQMEKNYKNCQSCGMPLKKDPQRGGTNTDGSISHMYCSYCYANGNFIQSDITAEQMQEFVKNKMKEMGFPGFLAKMFVKGIPKLERWKSK
ncbi:MAG TPA: zinc ribbon domain-containing protein [Bacteroidia bacterium]|nr:zinc ribbon domain-containing protein [Bacteroidia bacterium]